MNIELIKNISITITILLAFIIQRKFNKKGKFYVFLIAIIMITILNGLNYREYATDTIIGDIYEIDNYIILEDDSIEIKYTKDNEIVEATFKQTDIVYQDLPVMGEIEERTREYKSELLIYNTVMSLEPIYKDDIDILRFNISNQ